MNKFDNVWRSFQEAFNETLQTLLPINSGEHREVRVSLEFCAGDQEFSVGVFARRANNYFNIYMYSSESDEDHVVRHNDSFCYSNESFPLSQVELLEDKIYPKLPWYLKLMRKPVPVGKVATWNYTKEPVTLPGALLQHCAHSSAWRSTLRYAVQEWNHPFKIDKVRMLKVEVRGGSPDGQGVWQNSQPDQQVGVYALAQATTYLLPKRAVAPFLLEIRLDAYLEDGADTEAGNYNNLLQAQHIGGFYYRPKVKFDYMGWVVMFAGAPVTPQPLTRELLMSLLDFSGSPFPESTKWGVSSLHADLSGALFIATDAPRYTEY